MNLRTIIPCRLPVRGLRAAAGLAAAALCALAAALPPRAAHADATTYSTNKRQFKVGILLLDSTIVPGQEARGPENPDPHLFYIADSRNDIKPPNWELVNPLAPSTVTNEVKSRWDARSGGAGLSGYEIGQKVTKNMAAYWEVYLTQASITELLQFDCLFITNHRLVSLSSQDREKLRKVVDAGGIVWIEDCGNMRIFANGPFFLDELQFTSGTGAVGPVGPQINVPTHPLLNAPFQLSFQEIANLGDKNYADYSLRTLDKANPGSTIGLLRAPNPETLINIVGNTAVVDGNGKPLPYIAAGNYGSGAVIATASDSGCDINDYAGGTNVGSGGNSGPFCGPNLITAHNEDLKFLYNLVGWGGANSTERRNNRRTASSLETISAPLVRSFDFTNASTVTIPSQIVASNTSPLIIKNIMIVSGRANGVTTVRAYDLIPYRDADGDGNFDDGRADLSRGEPYDEIWRVEYGAAGAGQPSAPVYATYMDPNGAVIYQSVYVTLPDGSLAVLQFPSDIQGGLAAQPVQSTGTTINGGNYDPTLVIGGAPAPVYFENKIFMVEPSGLVVCREPLAGNALWKTFDGAAPGTGETLRPTGTPTLGFVRQDNASPIGSSSNQSTNDLMLYVPVLSALNGNNSAKVLAYWVGTRNEVQDRKWSNPPDGAAGFMDTRVHGGNGGPPQGRYFVAQRTGTAPFIRPTVRVFSNDLGTGRTSRENYIDNIISTAYTAQADANGNAILPDGKVQIVSLGGAPAPGPGQDVLISVDYDVSYIGTLGTPPQYTDNPSQIGARSNNNLTFNNPFSPLSTMALSPDDLLLFSTTQNVNTSAGATPPPVSSFVALKEQEGPAPNTKMPWRFALFNPNVTTPAGDALMERIVETITVRDIAPLRNRLAFPVAWPIVNSAIDFTKPPFNQAPEALTNVRFVGAPITTNYGTTFAMAVATSQANNGEVSVLMAFRTNPEITLTLPEPFNLTAGVSVLQADAQDETNGGTATVVAQGAQETNPNFTLDARRGRVTLTNFNSNGRYFSASQSFVVRYTPQAATQQKSVIVSPVPFDEDKTFSTSVDSTGNPASQSAGFTPLLWYYVLPGTPRSSPTLNGDFLFFTLARGPVLFAVAVDADPAAKDPTIRIGLGEQIRNVVSTIVSNALPETIDNNHVRMASQLLRADGTVGTSAPVGGGETLAINTSAGTFALSGATTLIADAKRIIEVTADSSAAWTLDSTLARLTVGGALPVYDPIGNVLNPPATGRVSVSRAPITRPTVARRLGGSDYLVVDSGNNRVVRTDRSGVTLWSLDKLYDPYDILASGDPLVLSNPSDVQTYVSPTYLNTEANPTTVVGYEIHYLIADTGNSRIIEVADYYDRDGRQTSAPGLTGAAQTESVGKHVVVYTTRTSEQGKPLRFQSVQRFSGASPNDPNLFGFPYLLAVVGSSTSGGGVDGGTDFTGGSIVALSYAPYNTAFTLRDSAGAGGVVRPWAYNANARSTEPRIRTVANGQVQFGANDLRINSATSGTIIKKLNRPSYLQQLSLPPQTAGGPPRLVLLICDADGVYAVESWTGPTRGPLLDVIWYFTQQDYDQINGLRPDNTLMPLRARLAGLMSPTSPTERRDLMPRFVPASVKLLPSGNYLITNSFSGPSRAMESGRFFGEVFEVNPNGVNVLGYIPNETPPNSARGGIFPIGSFSAPKLQSIDIGGGVFRNRQIMGQGVNTTNPVEQPLYADRP